MCNPIFIVFVIQLQAAKSPNMVIVEFQYPFISELDLP